ncbi:MAG TPA: tyrosine--tRNA ligase [Thermoplasmata archaeon]|nr:tyrosine--tRNA ligase [Thermoplasmata archaeon]
MDLEARVALASRSTREVLTREELEGVFTNHARPRAYIGFEPSGRLTIGHLVTARKMRDLVEAGCELTVFLADWHAWINDKLGGSLERIRASGEYMRAAFTALGVPPETARYRWASELTGRSEYWARVVRVAKATTLARTKRAMTIMGRGEEEANLDTAKLFYPAMQAADIFELPVEIAYAGIDQRRAHVLARETAHHYGWPVPLAIHTPLISSLKGGGRMDPATMGVEKKMSKSDPTGSITIPTTPEEIRARIASAFCPGKVLEANPVAELAEHVVFPWEGALEIHRPEKYGGPLRFETAAAFSAAYAAGEVHPQDLKAAVAGALERILAPASAYFAAHPDAIPSGI